jgi:acetoin utilization protein AcuB
MADSKIGGLPVMRGDQVVGIITETDLFKIFVEMMGAREEGIRVTVLVPEKHGELAELTQAISQIGGNFIAFGQFAGDDPTNREITFKVANIAEDQVRQAIQPFVEKIIDLRMVG